MRENLQTRVQPATHNVVDHDTHQVTPQPEATRFWGNEQGADPREFARCAPMGTCADVVDIPRLGKGTRRPRAAHMSHGLTIELRSPRADRVVGMQELLHRNRQRITERIARLGLLPQQYAGKGGYVTRLTPANTRSRGVHETTLA